MKRKEPRLVGGREYVTSHQLIGFASAGNGYINLCLSILLASKEGLVDPDEIREEAPQMWQDFAKENNLNQINWSPIDIALWVAGWLTRQRGY